MQPNLHYSHNKLLNQETIFHSMEQICHFQISSLVMSHTRHSHTTEQIYQWVKSIDIGNHYIASEIFELTDGYAIKNVVMCYLQLNNQEPGEVSL